MKKEASHYKQLDDNKVQCFLCPHLCKIAPEKVGFCGVRKNEDGKLYTLIYGEVSSVANDPIEKKPLFHFHPGTKVMSFGTVGCNMQCGHCQNWQISRISSTKSEISSLPACQAGQKYWDKLTEFISPEQSVDMAIEYGSKGIAWTYNEPTIWHEYTLETAKLCKEKGLYTVYVTNGYIMPEVLDEIGPYLDAFRVDLKGFSNEIYKKLAKVPKLQPILDATVRAKTKWNMHVECVTNIIPTINDDEKQLSDIAQWIKNDLGEMTPWHVTRFIPCLDYSHLYPTPVETLERAREIGFEEGLKYVYIGNVPGHKGENTYCHNCKKLLIDRVGYELGEMHIKDGKCAFCGSAILSP